MKRRYKKRTKIRTPYQTYSDYYDKLTKNSPDMLTPKYGEKEFYQQWELAKLRGLKNPATMVARSQRKWEYQFSRRYKARTGIELTGRETKEERQNIFMQYAELFPSLKEARESFEALY